MGKKKNKPATRRRKRVTGIGKNIPVQKYALGIVGAAIAIKGSEMMAKSTNTMISKAAPYAPAIVGIALPMLVKDQMVADVSAGLVIGGSIPVLKELKILSGFSSVRTIQGSPKGYMRLPDRRSSAASVNGTGQRGVNSAYTTKSNFSGSRMSQMNVISGAMSGGGSGSGAGDAMAV
jgi:hypothetical protein